MIIPHTRSCFAAHLAAQWAIEPDWAARTLAEVKARGMPVQQAMPKDPVGGGAAYDPLAGVLEMRSGIAIISIDGPMAKFDSKMGGSNTVRVRAALRQAAADEGVASIVLRVDSPGGTVDGTKELADEVTAAKASKKVFAYAEDLCASAALWVVAQADKVYANATALVGSIGVYTVLVDASKAYEIDGLKAILIGTGDMKGMGTEGLPITAEQVAYIQGIIDDRSKFFLQAIADGRGMSMPDVKALADGRVHIAAKAKALGLIDAVKTWDEVVAEAQLAKPKGKRRDRMAALIDLEGAE